MSIGLKNSYYLISWRYKRKFLLPISTASKCTWDHLEEEKGPKYLLISLTGAKGKSEVFVDLQKDSTVQIAGNLTPRESKLITEGSGLSLTDSAS